MATATVPEGAAVFVGRDEELRQVIASIADGRNAVVIAGPPGVGKSRLAAEVARALSVDGFVTERVLATRAIGSVPFGAFVPLLSELNTEDRFSMLRDAAAAIVRRAGSSRLVLTVDDAHLLDDGSAALLLQLAQGGECTLIVTVRTPAQTSGPVTELWKDQLAQRIDLAPLGTEDIEAMAAGLLGGSVSGLFARWLAQSSAGNPLYVRELILGAADGGALFQQEGLWFVRLPFAAPERLAELVAARLATLSDSAMDVADLLAIGEPLTFDLLEAIVGGDGVEEAERSGVVDTADALGSTARLAHPLYAEVRRQRMPRSRRRRLAQLLVDHYPQAEDAGGEDVIRRARWQLDTGTGDPKLFAEAAAHARRVFDLDLAIAMGQSAIDSGAGPMAALTVAEAYFFSGRPDEAETVLAEAARHCTTELETARIAHARVYNLGLVKGDVAAAEAVLAEAQAAVTESEAVGRLTVSTVTLRLWSRACPSALGAATALIESPDPAARDRGFYAASVISAVIGRTRDAHDFSMRGRTASSDAEQQGAHLVGPVIAARAEGAFADADKMIDVVYAMTPSLERTATFELLHGMLLVERGLVSRAGEKFRDALAINRELNETGTLRWCLGGVALSLALAGQRRAARAALDEVDALPSHVMSVFDTDLIDRGRAWTLAAGGDVAGARGMLAAAADQARDDGRWTSEMFLRHDMVRLGAPHTVADRLDQLTELVDGQLVGVMARHARAAASGTDLDTVANLFEQLGALLLAAEVGCAVADGFKRAGNGRQAQAWANHVVRLRAQCGPVHTPALDHGTDTLVLTPREREIAELAADGLSSRDIADRLVLSVRTVENHLQRAYTKLGVNTRDKLVQLL